MTEWLGWAATALFTASYFSRDPALLRRVQILAALLWIGYGVATGAMPVIVANTLLVAAAAIAGAKERRPETGRAS